MIISNLSQEEKDLLLEMAKDFGHDRYSTEDEIDYKLFEDISGKDLALYFVRKIISLKNITD